MRRTAILFAIVVLTAGCGDTAEAGRDVPIGPPASVPPSTAAVTPSSAAPTSVAPTDFAPKVSNATVRKKAIPPASVLGSEWKGPSHLSLGFPAIDNYVKGCSQAGGLKKRSESLKPRNGAFGFYDNVSQDVSLNQIQSGTGTDTIARATAFLDFLRTLPQACPSGKVLDKYPYKLEAVDGTEGDEELRLRMTVTLPSPYDPLLLDYGYVRQGGLVVIFYGEYTQVDEYLPLSFEHARKGLAGTVPGI